VFRVLFGRGSAFLDADAQSQIADIALRMKRGPLRALIVGHSDAHGSGRSNEHHAELRARLIADALEREGISRNLLRIEDASASQPLASNSTEIGRDLNRRVDVFLIPH
jgi:outer membrane protein OmpA-like peptidoglycan-associated protein